MIIQLTTLLFHGLEVVVQGKPFHLSDKHQKKDETRGRKPLPPRFVDADESEDDIEINDVPSTSSNYQTTDQILGFSDMEQEEETVPEQAVNEPEPVADVVQVTRKRGRPRKSKNVEESSTTVRRRLDLRNNF